MFSRDQPIFLFSSFVSLSVPVWLPVCISISLGTRLAALYRRLDPLYRTTSTLVKQSSSLVSSRFQRRKADSFIRGAFKLIFTTSNPHHSDPTTFSCVAPIKSSGCSESTISGAWGMILLHELLFDLLTHCRQQNPL